MSNKPTLANTDKKECHTKLQWDVSASQPSPGSAHAPHHHHASHNTPTQGPESKQNKACQGQQTLHHHHTAHNTSTQAPESKQNKARQRQLTLESTPPHHHDISHNTLTQAPESKQNKACQGQQTLQSRLHRTCHHHLFTKFSASQPELCPCQTGSQTYVAGMPITYDNMTTSGISSSWRRHQWLGSFFGSLCAENRNFPLSN